MENKRFDEWKDVDCNECSHYWDSSCDGITGAKKQCNSYLATRSILIPEKLKRLQKSIKCLNIVLICTDTTLLIHLLTHMVGGYNG